MARRNRYSRLSRHMESQSKRNLILSLIGALIVLFVMIRYGIPILANIAGFISGFHKTSNSSSNKGNSFVVAPILDPLPQATNSSEFYVSGQGQKGQEISIFVNDSLSDTKDTKDDGTFLFKVYLNQGENKIKVQAQENDKKSDFSDTENVSYANKAPKLDLSSPNDGQSFSKDDNPIQVKGSTDPGVKVTVNDFWAIIDDNNNFSYTLNLQNGDNNIKIVAVDEAGNKSEKSIKVNYSQ